MNVAVPTLSPGSVHIWRLDLDAGWPFDFLSADERERAARFRFDKDRQRFVNGRVALRFLLGKYLDVYPGALRFAYGSAGKPSLEGISFNLAHSGPHGLIGVARSGMLGVDVEEARAIPDLDDVARTVFAPGELQRWRALPAEEKVGAFYRIWTRKEAYLKAIGEGIAHRLQKFEVAFEEDEEPRILSGAEGIWTIADVSQSQSIVAAVAAEGSDVEVEVMAVGCG